MVSYGRLAFVAATGSELEDEFAWMMKAAKLPPFETQYFFCKEVLSESGKPRQFRFDFAFPEYKLAIEIDGQTYGRKCAQCGDIKAAGRHGRGGGIESDAEKYSIAAGLGWRVIRLTKKLVQSGAGLTLVETALAYSAPEAA